MQEESSLRIKYRQSYIRDRERTPKRNDPDSLPVENSGESEGLE